VQRLIDRAERGLDALQERFPATHQRRHQTPVGFGVVRIAEARAGLLDGAVKYGGRSIREGMREWHSRVNPLQAVAFQRQ
jgi:hypothetical protein